MAKNHPGYPADSVTLLSEQLIGKYHFDSYNFDHWGDSGNQGPDGLTTVPNRTTGGATHTTEDKVFIPSYTVYQYFTNADQPGREATIGADFGRFGGEYYHYWTRSPSELPISDSN